MKKVLVPVFLSIFHAAFSLTAALLGWYPQSVIVAVCSILTLYVGYKKLLFGKWSLLLVAPFYALYVPSSIILDSYMTYPIWITGILVCIATIFLLRIQAKKAWSILVLTGIILLNYGLVMPNNFAYLYQDRDPETIYKQEMLKLVDVNGRKIQPASFAGKILVLDVWNRGCVACIRGFPAFDRLSARYAADSNIIFATLYLHSKYFEDRSPSKLTAKYSFRKFYMFDPKHVDELPVAGFPTLLIWDKNLKCVYAGQLNTEPNVFIGNIHSIIRDLKRQP